jgi:hypothetical protein
MQNFAELIREILSNLIKISNLVKFLTSFKILTEVVKVSNSENMFLAWKSITSFSICFEQNLLLINHANM